MKSIRWLLLVSFLALLAVGCGGSSRAEEIYCEVGWRTDITLDIEEFEAVTIPNFEVSENLVLGDVMFNYYYQPGSEVRDRSLRIVITPAIGSPDLMETLYTLPLESGPTDQFQNRQGFTGQVSYINQESGSITEYSCNVSGN